FTPPQRSGGLVLKVEDDNEQAIVDQIMEKLVAQKII
ncbi:electron transfer flavoprotein subunit beta, partial [Megasphaera sp. BL7]